MYRAWAFVGVFFLPVYISASSVAPVPAVTPACPARGTFQGVIRHDKLSRDQLIKIELLVESETKKHCKLAFIVTLHLGDYSTTEYVTYFFSGLEYEKGAKRFFMDHPKQEISLDLTEFTDSKLVGRLRSDFAGNVGEFTTLRGLPAKPILPLIESLAGEYQGNCEGGKAVIQLYTHRFSEDSGRIGSPFAAFKINGVYGVEVKGGCMDDSSAKFCQRSIINGGSYNFFKEKLVLMGTMRNFSCSRTVAGLDCGHCKFKKVAPVFGARVLSHPAASKTAPQERAITGNLRDLDGEYYGYLHHDFLGLYQRASLSVLTHVGDPVDEDDDDEDELRLSALANLHFGDYDSLETISYRFAEEVFPLAKKTPQLVLDHGENDVDALLVVTKAGNKKISGIWYSIRFGRVGEFQLYRDAAPSLASGDILMEAVSGDYRTRAGDWYFNLLINLAVIPSFTENPFLPLNFGGHFQFRDSPRAQVIGGGYDFYTGQLGIELNGGEFWVGSRRNADEFYLKKVSYAPLVSLKPFAPGKLVRNLP